MSADACKFCQNGFLGNRFGEDVECVNGVLIDIDRATEGRSRAEAYPPAPCEACLVCGGAGHMDDDSTPECETCHGSGWRSGENESQQRLEDWANP